MSKLYQKSYEKPSIIPSGFAGFIIGNSNVSIRNTYMQKGTSFINAFDNTDAVITDCGTPVITQKTTQQTYKALSINTFKQKSSKTLPFWVHYKVRNIKDSDQGNVVALNQESSYVFRLGYVPSSDFLSNPLKTAKKYRDEIEQVPVDGDLADFYSTLVPVTSLVDYRLNQNAVQNRFRHL